MEFAGLVTQVYVDVMLAVNLLMDFFILWAAGRLANIKTSFGRLLLGAMLGASYSLVIFFPDSVMLNSLPAKIGCSLLMVLLAFYPVRLRVFLRALVFLYMISFAMGGAVIAANYLSDDTPGFLRVMGGVGILGGGLHYGWLLLGLSVALLIGWFGLAYSRKSKLQKEYVSPLNISLAGRILTTKGLLDTGNQLCDPLTNKPVVVVESEVLKEILPLSIWQAVNQDDLAMYKLAAGLEQEWASRIRLIPFSSVGRNKGMMAGIRPDWIEVVQGEECFRRTDIILGLVNKTLCKEGRYHALLPPAVYE